MEPHASSNVKAMAPSFCPLCSAPLEAQGTAAGEIVTCSKTGERVPAPALEMIRSNLFSEPPFASGLHTMLFDAPWYCARCGREHTRKKRRSTSDLWSTDLYCEACERQYAQGTALTIIQLFRPAHDREASDAAPNKKPEKKSARSTKTPARAKTKQAKKESSVKEKTAASARKRTKP